MREKLGMTTDEAREATIKAMLISQGKLCRKMRREWDNKVKQQREEDLLHAHKRNKPAEVERISRLLARRGLAPKKRRYNAVKVRQTKEDWINELKKPGNQGGMSATLIDYGQGANGMAAKGDPILPRHE